MKKLLALILALVMVLSLTACGKSKATYNDAGYYEIFSSTDEDGTMSRADYDAADWLIFLQLDEDGTGVLDWDDGDTDALTWSDGSITAGGKTYSYALAGGMLTLEVDDGAVYILKKTEAPAAEQAAAGGFGGLIGKGKAAAEAANEDDGKDEDTTPSIVGTYELIDIVAEDPSDSATAEDIQMLADMGLTCELTIRGDGTGLLVLFDEETDVTWDDSTITTVNGESADYTLDGDTLTLTEDTSSLIFRRSGDADAKADEGDSAEKPAAPAAVGGSFTPVEGEINDYYVSIVGAESFTDHDDKDGIRFYFEFTNNDDEPTSAFVLDLEAEQDGYELVDTYAWSENDAPEYGNSGLMVEPGVTILCIDEFNFKPDGGEITLTVSNYGSDTLTATFDPANLPGRPAEWKPTPITDPQYYLDYPAAGSTDDYYIEITDAEIVAADSWYDYDEVIRAYFNFTNNQDEATSCWWATNVYAFQDGVQLDTGYPATKTDSDEMFNEDVEPGGTATCSRCWVLRSDSPVEVVFQTWQGVVAAGTFYPG